MEATVAAIEALEELRIPYMLVGSLSSNAYGIARSTKDADIVVELGAASITDLVRKLGPEFRLDPQISFETVTGTTRHVVQLTDTPFTIEFFRLSNDAHDQERFRRRRRVPLPDGETVIPTAEDVIIMKLRWVVHGRRTKDIDDIRDVIAVQGDALDWQYIHRWCDQHGTREKLDEIRRSIPPL
jgi:hypothetical protein